MKNAILLFLMYLPCLQAQEIGYKGIEIGTSLSKLAEDKNLSCKASVSGLFDTLCYGISAGLDTYAGQDVSNLTFAGKSDKLLLISFNMNSKFFPDVMTALEKRYGKFSCKKSTVANQLNAQFDQASCLKSGKGWSISTTKRQPDINTSSYMIASDEVITNFQAVDAKKKAAAEKDL